ncbi:hypothetical protein C8039_08445 [Halogeometricum sp. wsp3]|nr:hypothetical protein C8039_08445 [Halogeometricum sp. wsp3]
MCKDDLVSVVMPTYNESDYIREAISSILNQSYANLELIIVDGGSTDGTIDKINKLDSNKINLIVEQKRQGISSALNKGIREANGEYVARMDADDRSLPERISCQISIINQKPEIKLVSSWYRFIDAIVNYL